MKCIVIGPHGGLCLRKVDETQFKGGVLFFNGSGGRATVFDNPGKAATAINRSERYAKHKNYDGDAWKTESNQIVRFENLLIGVTREEIKNLIDS